MPAFILLFLACYHSPPPPVKFTEKSFPKLKPEKTPDNEVTTCFFEFLKKFSLLIRVFTMRKKLLIFRLIISVHTINTFLPKDASQVGL